MKKLLNKLHPVLRHFLFWLLPYGIICLLQLSQADAHEYNWFTQVTGSFLVMVGISYGNVYLCRRFFFSQKRTYLFAATLMYCVYILAVYVFLYPVEDSTLTGRQSTLFTTLFFYSVFFLLIFLISFVFWLATAAYRKDRELAAAKLQVQEFKNDQLDAENKFLQSQINPHFLYNTLNFFYAEALDVSPRLADSILLLSDSMRYALEIKENAKGMTLLENELTHINNLIRINQYRFHDQLQIQFLISGDIKSVCIAPLVLITFVENAFKHGELQNPRDPLVISLQIATAEQQIIFSTNNRIKKGSKEISTGIGIDNAKRRLQHLYGNQYKLEITQDEEYYSVSLALPLYKDFTL